MVLLYPICYAKNNELIDSIYDAHIAIQNKKMTCEKLVEFFLTRIKQYNLSIQNGPPINAIVEISPLALKEAKKLDSIYKNTHQLAGPLHCIPVVVKDNINTYDMTATSGSYALLGSHPTKDAEVIAKLRQAGAIILAKGAMDEFAAGMFGKSSRSGRIGNVYNTYENPGGSSGGVAAAVSANFALIGVGTDTTGSILIPAAFNGVIGLRPTIGLLSQKGIFPAGNIDTVSGPITRNVQDLTIVMQVLYNNKNYKNNLIEHGLNKKRIGIISRLGKFNITSHLPSEMKTRLKQVIKQMQQAGATIINNIELPEYNSDRTYNMAGTYEDVNRYLSSFPTSRKNFKEICTSERTRAFGNKTECLQFINSIPSKEAASKAITVIKNNSDYVQKIMKQHQLDALLMPISLLGVATYDNNQMIPTPFPSNAGFPAITILVGYQKGVPIGFALIGKPYAEAKLIEMAYSYEKHFFRRHEPNLYTDLSFNEYSIIDLNNLYTLIGIDTYKRILKNQDAKALSGDVFRKLVFRIINKKIN